MKKLAVALMALYALLVAFSSKAEFITVGGVIANTGGNPVEIYFTDADSIVNMSVLSDPYGLYNVVVTTDDSSGVLVIFFFDCDSNIVDTIVPYYTGMPPIVFNADFCDSLGTDVCLSAFTPGYDSLTQAYTLQIDSVVQQNAVAYLWDFGNGDTLTEFLPTYVFNDTGSYQICMTVTEADGQQCTGCQTVFVDSAGATISVIPFGMVSNATLNRLTRSLQAYPNPVTTHATLRFHSFHQGVVHVNVVNAIGGVIRTQTIHVHTGENSLKVDMQNLPAGVYMLQLNDGRNVTAARAVKH